MCVHVSDTHTQKNKLKKQMENFNLFRKIAYNGVTYDQLNIEERKDLVKNKKYLDERLQSYHPNIINNWNLICENLQRDGLI